MWARAYRDREYHAAVNTNNGTEAQNKVLEYNYLPKKTMTLSSIATILVEDYLPDAQRKYIFQKFQQSPYYRSYDTVPTYLHGRPRNIIPHCLDRKGSSNKFTLEDIEDANAQQGLFSVHSSKGKVYTVNFGLFLNIRCLIVHVLIGALITYLASTFSLYFCIEHYGHGIALPKST